MVDLFDVGFVGVVVSSSNIGIGFLPRIRDRISRWEMSGGFVVTRAYEDSVPLQGSAGVITGYCVGSRLGSISYYSSWEPDSPCYILVHHRLVDVQLG